MAVIPFNYTPIPIHLPFHTTSAREKAAVGAVGSGKTLALCGDAILLGLQQPGSRIMIARNTVPALKITTEHEFLTMLQARTDAQYEDPDSKTLYDFCTISRSGGHVDSITFPNGSEFYFRSLDDWRKHMSVNLAAFYIDEASEVEYEAYLGLYSRIRQTIPTDTARRQGHKRITRHIAAICANPEGHNWIWEHFVQAPKLVDPSDTSVAAESIRNRVYYRSTSFDNPHLYNPDGTPGDYLLSLLSYPEVWVRRMVLCEFDAFAGQIYPFKYDEHIIEHFTPPADWERAMGLDWGLRNPTAVVWWARRPGTNRWIQYREWQTYDSTDPHERESYETMNVHQICDRVRQLEAGETIKYRVADPAIKQRTADNGKSVHYWFNHYGMYCDLGAKKYDDRINALAQLMHRGELQFMDNNPQTAIAIQQYRWTDIGASSREDGQERPVKRNDHLVNACEYLATKFMTPTTPTPEKPRPPTRDEEIWQAVRKRQEKQVKQQRARRTGV